MRIAEERIAKLINTDFNQIASTSNPSINNNRAVAYSSYTTTGKYSEEGWAYE